MPFSSARSAELHLAQGCELLKPKPIGSENHPQWDCDNSYDGCANNDCPCGETRRQFRVGHYSVKKERGEQHVGCESSQRTVHFACKPLHVPCERTNSHYQEYARDRRRNTKKVATRRGFNLHVRLPFHERYFGNHASEHGSIILSHDHMITWTQ